MKILSELLDEQNISRTLMRLTHEILEKNQGTKNLGIICIRNRVDVLARRIINHIKEFEDFTVPLGILDITLYRDDFQRITDSPIVQETDFSFDITDKKIILVDDVLFTGRTVRAALDALIDYGRPAMIQLAVLLDRGHRELPIKADFVGKNVPTSTGQQVQVKLKEVDGEDRVLLVAY